MNENLDGLLEGCLSKDESYVKHEYIRICVLLLYQAVWRVHVEWGRGSENNTRRMGGV